MLSLREPPKFVVHNTSNMGAVQGHMVNIMRPFVLQNPFPITESARRDDVLRMFGEYLIERLDSPSELRRTLDELVKRANEGTQVHLLCCCKPKKCHGDIIAEALTYRLRGNSWKKVAEYLRNSRRLA